MQPGWPGPGVAPTTATAGEHADAYLWVKRPGESDGSCNRGEPPAAASSAVTPWNWSRTPDSSALRLSDFMPDAIRLFDAHLHIIDPRFPLQENNGYNVLWHNAAALYLRR